MLAGGIAIAGAASWAARRRQHAGEIAVILGIARIGVVLITSGSLFVIVFGFWLVEESGRGLDEGWLAGSLGILLLALVLGALGGQRPKRARLLAERLAKEDRGRGAEEELARLLRDTLSLVLNIAASTAIVAVLLLMIWKPG